MLGLVVFGFFPMEHLEAHSNRGALKQVLRVCVCVCV